VSPDPILNSYLPTGDKEKDKNLPGMGGVFNTVNLDLYHYAGLNPVKFVDPDGNNYAAILTQGLRMNVSPQLVQQVAQIALAASGIPVYIRLYEMAVEMTQTKTNTKRPEWNVMRLQLQTGKHTPFGLPIINSEEIGVTKSQVFAELQALNAETLAINPELAKSKEFQSAIISMSVKVKNLLGGVTQGGNVLRTKFKYQGTEYRIDLENLRGHNLRE